MMEHLRNASNQHTYTTVVKQNVNVHAPLAQFFFAQLVILNTEQYGRDNFFLQRNVTFVTGSCWRSTYNVPIKV